MNDDDDGWKFNTPSEEPPSYSYVAGAFQHVYLLALGEFDIDSYANGDHKVQYFFLMSYFFLASFLFVIHLLNMLIAIMGEVFAENNEKKKMLQTKNHLQLVLDNMWMSDVIKDRKKIKYLIVAHSSQEDKDEEDLLNSVIQKQTEVQNANNINFEIINYTL